MSSIFRFSGFRFSGLHRISLAFLLASAASASVSAKDELIWNPLNPDNTVYLQLQEGTVVIELNPAFAPKTVKQFKALLEEQFYRGLSFYRVIDGFVAQGGDESDIGTANDTPALKAEFEINWPLKPEDKEAAKNWQPMSWTLVQKDDMFAPYTGFIDGFAAARDEKKAGKAWLAHCPGTVAMARKTDPDTGSTDFYIVIGQAPRYLDRNLTIFGRVVWGDKRLNIYVADTNSRGFKQSLQERRNRKDKFFHHNPPKILDICQVPVPARLEKNNL